jgi:hypothetical protein
VTGERTRHCIKCGREIGPEETICAACNRAGMTTPSATQYHGTMVAAIIAGVVVLAIAASLAMRGIGPFEGQVLNSEPVAGDRVAVSVTVGNQGERSGRARCQLVAYDGSGRSAGSRSFVTVEISGGASVEVDEVIPGVTSPPARVEVSCRG